LPLLFYGYIQPIKPGYFFFFYSINKKDDYNNNLSCLSSLGNTMHNSNYGIIKAVFGLYNVCRAIYFGAYEPGYLY